MTTRIALVTAAGIGIAEDDQLLVDAMRARGWHVASVAWDDEQADWTVFDLIWLRSCWDYHRRYAEFSAWLDRAERAGARWVNPASLVRWNAHKRYLLELADAGIPVPPLLIVSKGKRFDTAGFLSGTEWPEAIIKPAVSASAYRTWRSGGASHAESAARAAEILADGDLILQRFVPEIATRGEWSLVLIDGTLSHAVRKVPRAGEFRSQRDNGAAVAPDEPPAAVVDVARAALAHAARHGTPRVARVDIIEAAAGPVVMELELIEPVLFFGYKAGAAERVVDALVDAGADSVADPPGFTHA